MNSIAAVVVTYHPTSELIESLRAIARSVRHTYIVDNGSAPNNPVLIEAEGLPNVTLLRLNFNLGIASALNRGVKLGLDSGADWILTLDQDTLLTGDAINKMLEAYEIHPNKNKIGVLAPSHFDKDTGYQSRYLRGLKGPYTIRQIVMSSGSLIPRATFKIVPYFDDDLFIDLVDHDFCLKVRKAGLEIIIVRHAQMAHSLGNIKRHAIGPFSFFSYNYPLERQYYRARNRVILYRRHFGAWIWQDQEFAVKDLLKVILVEDNKWEKLKAIFQGTLDGLLGRMGCYHGATYQTPKAQKYFIEFREEIVPLLPQGTIERALDLGCGSGETSGYLKEIGKVKWVCGIEGSPDAAATALQRLDQVLEGDIEKLSYPFEDSSFDLILCLDILEHLIDPWTVVKRLKKLLKPGGRMVVSLPNVRHFSVLMPLIFLGDWRYSQEGLLDSTHIRFFTRNTATKLFSLEGLEIKQWDHTGAKKGLSGIANKLTLGIFRDFFIFQNLMAFESAVADKPTPRAQLPIQNRSSVTPPRTEGSFGIGQKSERLHLER